MKTKEDILKSSREIKVRGSWIYALIDGNEIVYIGQSTNLIMRLGSHISQREKKFDRWAIVEDLGDYCSDNELNKMEKRYIRKYTPKYNHVHNPKSSFKQDMRDRRSEEKRNRREFWKRHNERRYSNIVSRK
jgi:predicted GIY-YIG superfamily endonuclease